MLQKLRKYLSVKSCDCASDAGLLIIRIGVFGSLLLKHGLEKIDPAFWSTVGPQFPDPAHIGHLESLTIALISDFVCSILLVLGLFSRFAAAYVFAVLSVAWVFTHHFIYFGKGIEPKHGELIVVYFTVSLGVALLGPGKYSLDRLIFGKREA